MYAGRTMGFAPFVNQLFQVQLRTNCCLTIAYLKTHGLEHYTINQILASRGLAQYGTSIDIIEMMHIVKYKHCRALQDVLVESLNVRE